jgi:HlyD family secretion protein
MAPYSMKPLFVFVIVAVLASPTLGQTQSDTQVPAAWSGSAELQAVPAVRPGEGFVEIPRCFTGLISDVDVPAQESGPLVAMDVREGDIVEAGQELARIDDSLSQLRLDTARTKLDAARQKANNDIDIRAAQNALEIAEREQRTNQGLHAKGALPKWDYDRSILQARQAALQLEQAQRDQEAAMKEVQIEDFNVRASAESIDRHRILSPVAGNVMERYKECGEWVNAGDNVLRVARMDQLCVQGLLDSGLYNPHEIQGRPVVVTAQLAHGTTEQFTGRIVFVALEKATSGFWVRAEVDNRQVEGHWLLLANEEVSMRIQLDATVAGRPAETGTQR